MLSGKLLCLVYPFRAEHEHQRPDRDKFIKVLYENVEPGLKGTPSDLLLT